MCKWDLQKSYLHIVVLTLCLDIWVFNITIIIIDHFQNIGHNYGAIMGATILATPIMYLSPYSLQFLFLFFIPSYSFKFHYNC